MYPIGGQRQAHQEKQEMKGKERESFPSALAVRLLYVQSSLQILLMLLEGPRIPDTLLSLNKTSIYTGLAVGIHGK